MVRSMSLRTVRLVGLFLLALGFAAGAEAQYFGRNKITYRDFDWKIYHSPHFDVHYYTDEEASLQKIVSMAESAYDRLSRRFDFQIQEPTPLIFYATHSAFEQNNILLNFIPEGVGAFATPARFRMVLPVDLPDPQLFALVMHELTHIFQYHVLFQGSLSRAATSRPPIWFMEGMASYMADDEEANDRMYLRDAVVNDQIPPITQANVQGYFAYRFGHAVFDFIEERWGQEGLLDFIYEFRNTLGGRIDRAVERAFRIEGEDFDRDFRRWLRKKYLPELLETGEPSDFGRPFRIDNEPNNQATSPVASPSGDLVAAFATYKGEIDIALYETKTRKFLRNLTRGLDRDYQYLIAQGLVTGRVMGKDLAFSPDGNTLAVFVKRERGRSLLLIDVLEEGRRRVIDMDDMGVEQQLSPVFTADGRGVLFSGWKGGQFDIFRLDLDTEELTAITNDALFDGSPAPSPDGQSVVVSSVVGEYKKLFRIDFANPGVRVPLVEGDWNSYDATYSPDGSRIYFTSDETSAQNIYSLDLAKGELAQHTNVVTGAFMPTLLHESDGTERLVYTGYWKFDFDLYLAELEEPVGPVRKVTLASAGTAAGELPAFQPDIEVTIDPANTEDYRRFKMFLEDAQTLVGVDNNQTLLGQIQLQFTDYLGDQRLFVTVASVDSFSNFDFLYLNRKHRTQWTVNVFDDRSYFLARDFVTGGVRRGQAAYRETGVRSGIQYPFSFSHRFEAELGYVFRDIDFQSFVNDPNTGEVVPIVTPRKDDYPQVGIGLVGDTTIFGQYGPMAGRRWRLAANYAPDLDESGTLTQTASLDARQYIPLGERSNFAFRVFGAVSEGNFPQPFFFGGLDTLRGFEFREIVGDRAFYANAELRFPIIDAIILPFMVIQGVRAVVFLDIGGAYFADGPDYEFWDSDERRLVNGFSSYGFGITARMLGVDLNWDLAKIWDLKDTLTGYRTSFWIGTRF